MEIPERVEDWTLDTVKEVVRKHEFEPGRFDYKAYLQPATRTSDPDHTPSIRRTVCSMANADGGFILFGVLDRSIKVRSLDDRIVGFSLGKDLLKQFGEKIQVIQPDAYFEASPAPIKLSDPAKGIFVVHVPTSPRRPHMVEATGVFYRRGEGGHAIQMNFYEVREQMLRTEERFQKVNFLRLLIALYRKEIQLTRQSGDNMVHSALRFDTAPFMSALADVSGLIPTTDNLLENLLEIPVEANMVNNLLDQVRGQERPLIRGGNMELPFRPYFEMQLINLDTDCANCEERLAKAFGPLRAEERSSTSPSPK